MSDDPSDFFAAPPFKPADALATLERQLRDLKLTKREGVFERRGQAMADARVDGDAIAARLVRRPGRVADWEPGRRLKSSADVRRFVDDLKQRLARWDDRDE